MDTKAMQSAESNSRYDSAKCGPGTIEKIRFLFNGDTVIKLDTVPNENYTDQPVHAKLLLDIFYSNLKVELITTTCRRTDFGFGEFKVFSQ